MAATLGSPTHAAPASYAGSTVILPHYYWRDGKYKDLTIFVVQEKPSWDGGRWTAPMGGAKHHQSPAGCAAAELLEELYVDIPPADMEDGAKFARVDCHVVGPHTGEQHVHGVFIALRPEALATSQYGRAEWRRRREHYVALREQARAAGDVAESRRLDAFCEIQSMSHVVVRSLLDAVAGHREGGGARDCTVRDIDRTVLHLRDVFTRQVKELRVRAVLQKLLEVFEARRGNEPELFHQPAVGGAERPLPPTPFEVRGLPADDLDEVLSVPAADGSGRVFKMYVGAAGAAYSLSTIKAHRVTHVVNCCVSDLRSGGMQAWTPFARHGVKYGVVQTDDTASGDDPEREDPGGQWHAVMALLREAWREGGTALVHCYMGINRSATTAAVFLTLHGMAPSVDAAIALLQSKRGVVNPKPEYRAYARAFVAGAQGTTPLAAGGVE